MQIYLSEAAINFWGEDLQLDMAVEEAAELIHAIQQFRRNRSPEKLKQLIDEMSDLRIVIEVLKVMFDTDLVRHSYREKIVAFAVKLEMEELKRYRKKKGLD